MPPSGYSTEQTKHIRSFLYSCAMALMKESKHNHALPMSALEEEIQAIKNEELNGNLKPIERCILQLTRLFYEELLKYDHVDWTTFDEKSKFVSDEFGKIISKIKVLKIRHSNK